MAKERKGKPQAARSSFMSLFTASLPRATPARSSSSLPETI